MLYHWGMFYTTWDWHVKSRYAGPTIEPAMQLLSPWRLPLLFLISGVAVRFALDKAGGRWAFARKRTWRLFLPLLFGVLVIVPPQSWLELLGKGETAKGFLAFYPDYLRGGFSIITPTWNHLWYLAYILVYTLLVVPLAPWLRRVDLGRWAAGLPLMLAAYLAGVALLLEPRFPDTLALVDDWAVHARSLAWFAVGFVVAKTESVWASFHRLRWVALVLALGLGGLVWHDFDAGRGVVRQLYAVATVVAVCGFARHALDRPSAWLTRLGAAIFPVYIIHQTLIIVSGVALSRAGVPLAAEVVGIAVATVFGCWLFVQIGKRAGPLAPLFGMARRA